MGSHSDDQPDADIIAPIHYDQLLRAPAAIRTTTQAGAVAATGAATALFTSGALGAVSDEQSWVQMIGVAAVALWAASALLYVFAVTAPIQREDPREVNGADEFVSAVLNRADLEQRVLGERATRALVVTAIAVGATLATIIGAIGTADPIDRAGGELTLTREGRAVLGPGCAQRGRIRGTLDVDSLEKRVVVFQPARCRRYPKTLRIERSLVGSFAEG